jgi:hypothetical protein
MCRELQYFRTEEGRFERHTLASFPGASEYRVVFATDWNDVVVAAFANDQGGVYAAYDLKGGGTRVHPEPARAISAAIDDEGRLVIAFRSEGHMWFATQPEVGEWTPMQVDDGAAGAALDLALDSSGDPWIASFSCDGICTTSEGGTSWIHTRSDDAWTSEPLDVAGPSIAWPVIAVDQDDAVHVAFTDVRDGAVHYVTNQLALGEDTICDGVPGVDYDRDGHASILTGGEDCDDEDAAIDPGAIDADGGRDGDCDGRPD